METAPPRDQRLLKLFIRLMLPVVTLAGFGGLASILALGLNEGKTISAVYSPDGRYRARVMEAFGSGGCGRVTSYIVLVERRWHSVKTGSVEPFCFIGSPAQLVVSWSAANTLAISCTACNPESTFAYDQNWGGLHFAFDVQRQ